MKTFPRLSQAFSAQRDRAFTLGTFAWLAAGLGAFGAAAAVGLSNWDPPAAFDGQSQQARAPDEIPVAQNLQDGAALDRLKNELADGATPFAMAQTPIGALGSFAAASQMAADAQIGSAELGHVGRGFQPPGGALALAASPVEMFPVRRAAPQSAVAQPAEAVAEPARPAAKPRVIEPTAKIAEAAPKPAAEDQTASIAPAPKAHAKRVAAHRTFIDALVKGIAAIFKPGAPRGARVPAA